MPGPSPGQVADKARLRGPSTDDVALWPSLRTQTVRLTNDSGRGNRTSKKERQSCEDEMLSACHPQMPG